VAFVTELLQQRQIVFDLLESIENNGTVLTRSGVEFGARLGQARTPQDYVRESIVNPHAHLVPGPTFSFGGRSIMPAFDTILKPDEIDQLVAYLVTFK